MRPGLVATFDLRRSFGIADTVFAGDFIQPPASLGDIGVTNPLGWGTTFDVDGGILGKWRVAAQAQVHRAAMEDSLGWVDSGSEDFDAFKQRLATLIGSHPVETCTLTVYSIGVVYLQLRFAKGLPVAFCEGLLNCFEFAGYTPPMSKALYEAADAHRRRALAAADGPLGELTQREPPVQKKDVKGYEESDQFSYFRHVVVCIDDGDATVVPELLAGVTDPIEELPFQYHGTLHYSSGLFVFESKDLDGSADVATRAVDAQRVLVDIEIAHVFEGLCDAFSRLVLDAIRDQVNGYGQAVPTTPDPQRLNRLRAVALAVVNLTQFDLVTPTEEDQRFFTRFKAEAKLAKKQSLITRAVDVLYNVQVAEEQEEESQRATRIGRFATLLTSLTLISVLVDSYNFVREDEAILPGLILRTVTLVLLLALILLLALRTGFRGQRLRGSAQAAGTSPGPT